FEPSGWKRTLAGHLAGRPRRVWLEFQWINRRPLLDARRRRRRAGTAPCEVAEHKASERLLSRRPISDLRRTHGRAPRPMDPTDRSTDRGESKADSVSGNPGGRDLRSVLARRQVDRLQL